ncbi:MAG: DUF354 domain-containing protein [Balneolaceae bacterium]|nr:DUF354 domain-containing protein [Balneolaceae bacterium]
MSVLFDINHPAHVHYFKHIIARLREQGTSVTVVAREKDVTLTLLKANSIPFISRGKGGSNILSRFLYQFKAIRFIKNLIKLNNVDLVISFMHPYGAQAAKFSGIPSIAFTDTENAVWHHRFTLPFLNNVFSSEIFKKNLGVKHKRFPGFMEFSYLHPDYFKPDLTIKSALNLNIEDKYCVVRFVSRKSMHDINHPGLNDLQKIQIVKELSSHLKVFVSSEIPLPEILKKYELNVEAQKMHSVLKGADFFFGESATMASESAILGVPSVYIDNSGRGYTDVLEAENHLIKRFEESNEGVLKALAESKRYLTSNPSFFDNRKPIKINFDLTAYMHEIINGYLK